MRVRRPPCILAAVLVFTHLWKYCCFSYCRTESVTAQRDRVTAVRINRSPVIRSCVTIFSLGTTIAGCSGRNVEIPTTRRYRITHDRLRAVLHCCGTELMVTRPYVRLPGVKQPSPHATFSPHSTTRFSSGFVTYRSLFYVRGRQSVGSARKPDGSVVTRSEVFDQFDPGVVRPSHTCSLWYHIYVSRNTEDCSGELRRTAPQVWLIHNVGDHDRNRQR